MSNYRFYGQLLTCWLLISLLIVYSQLSDRSHRFTLHRESCLCNSKLEKEGRTPRSSTPRLSYTIHALYSYNRVIVYWCPAFWPIVHATFVFCPGHKQPQFITRRRDSFRVHGPRGPWPWAVWLFTTRTLASVSPIASDIAVVQLSCMQRAPSVY